MEDVSYILEWVDDVPQVTCIQLHVTLVCTIFCQSSFTPLYVEHGWPSGLCGIWKTYIYVWLRT